MLSQTALGRSRYAAPCSELSTNWLRVSTFHAWPGADESRNGAVLRHELQKLSTTRLLAEKDFAAANYIAGSLRNSEVVSRAK
jgi:hypothetical protein